MHDMDVQTTNAPVLEIPDSVLNSRDLIAVTAEA